MDFDKDLGEIECERKRLEDELCSLKEDVRPAQYVGKRIRELYIEINSKKIEKSDEFDEQRELDEINKMNIPTVMEAFGQELHILKSFRDNYETLVVAEALREKENDTNLIRKLQDEVKKLRELVTKMTLEKSEALDKADIPKRIAIDTAHVTIDVLKEDNTSLIEQLLSMKQELCKIREAISESEKTIHIQQMKMRQIGQYEAQLHSQKMQQAHRIQQLLNHVSQQQAERRQIEDYIGEVEAECDRFERELEEINEAVDSMKAEQPRQKMKEENARIGEMEAKLKETDEKMAKAKIELRKAQQAGEIVMKKNKEMKNEYDKLFESATEAKKRFLSGRDDDDEESGLANDRKKGKMAARSLSSAASSSSSSSSARRGLRWMRTAKEREALIKRVEARLKRGEEKREEEKRRREKFEGIFAFGRNENATDAGLDKKQGGEGEKEEITKVGVGKGKEKKAKTGLEKEGDEKEEELPDEGRVYVSGIVSEMPATERVYQRIVGMQRTKIRTLTDEVRRLMAEERRSVIEEESHRMERARYETEIAALKMDMKRQEEIKKLSTLFTSPSLSSIAGSGLSSSSSSSIQSSSLSSASSSLASSAMPSSSSSSSSSFSASAGSLSPSSHLLHRTTDTIERSSVHQRAQTIPLQELIALIKRNDELEELYKQMKTTLAVNETITAAYERLLSTSSSSSSVTSSSTPSLSAT
eukprot:MONOS_4117.1-p1 / transcript=MONOS_4117.1 / gene=MONOS_4117 / organism=Monocercomonoides_exilis_PA203 / gene_product=unspecified product / transcript_product=unspecified product / location=Mono_scaffold00105:36516-39558(-) / protein_length=703 / sequence_SO=supercontig / SO=protein_coding / is_pseudo=false